MSASIFRAAIAAALIAASPASAGIAQPTVHFIYPAPYGTIFDRVCKEWLNRDVEQADIDELLARKAEFEAQWRTTGAQYMRLATEATGRAFPYSEIQATMTLCTPDSMAFPLFIRMKSFLGSGTEDGGHDFPLLVFHELMHHYANAIEAKSQIFAKYADLPFSVRAHIHVVAFERYVLEKTGRIHQLEKLREYYAKDEDSTYHRAWRIVDKEGVAAVIADAGLKP
ncbi:MAG: hypothetical protein H3C60_04750 [Sphingomonadaceae bacterium]|nr:hypothetical protein [Sphingomonadaceae bacterium]